MYTTHCSLVSDYRYKYVSLHMSLSPVADNTPLIIGLVVAAVILVLLLIVVVFIIVLIYMKRKDTSESLGVRWREW